MKDQPKVVFNSSHWSAQVVRGDRDKLVLKFVKFLKLDVGFIYFFSSFGHLNFKSNVKPFDFFISFSILNSNGNLRNKNFQKFQILIRVNIPRQLLTKKQNPNLTIPRLQRRRNSQVQLTQNTLKMPLIQLLKHKHPAL